VAVPVQQAFDFYVDALNLEPMTPPWLHFKVTTPGELILRQGTLLDYRLRLHGVPVRWQTLIEIWEPPLRFVDIQAKGPYSHWEHTHLFEPDGEAATVIHDRVRYAIPLGPLGAIAHRLFVRRDLERIFDFRAEVASERLVSRSARSGGSGSR
jgi:ligand-binding SRPBCC domain-containing protein